MSASLLSALDGLLHAATTQRNMKIHLVSGLLVGLVGSGIPLGLAEKVTLIFCVILVLFAEMLNTALEALVDLHTEDFHELAAVAKEVAAGGVVVLAGGTVVIFAALLIHNWPAVTSNVQRVLVQATLGVPLAVLTALLLWRRQRPAWLNHAMFASGVGLLVALAMRTSSIVFTALTAALFCVAWAAARRVSASSQPLEPRP